VKVEYVKAFAIQDATYLERQPGRYRNTGLRTAKGYGEGTSYGSDLFLKVMGVLLQGRGQYLRFVPPLNEIVC